MNLLPKVRNLPLEDIVKDPYVFEFLGIPENRPILESELEKALVRRASGFLSKNKNKINKAMRQPKGWR